MTASERIKAISFPKEFVGKQAAESPSGPGQIYKVGLFPSVGTSMHRAPWCVVECGHVYDPFDIKGSMPGEDGRIDIAKRVRSLIDTLIYFGQSAEIRHSDIAAECEEEWSEDYAIACEAYSPYGDSVDSDYFNHDRCLREFKKFVRGFFAGDPTVDVKFHNIPDGSNEIEFTRSPNT